MRSDKNGWLPPSWLLREEKKERKKFQMVKKCPRLTSHGLGWSSAGLSPRSCSWRDWCQRPVSRSPRSHLHYRQHPTHRSWVELGPVNSKTLLAIRPTDRAVHGSQTWTHTQSRSGDICQFLGRCFTYRPWVKVKDHRILDATNVIIKSDAVLVSNLPWHDFPVRTAGRVWSSVNDETVV